MKVRVKLSESSDTEKTSACLLQQCKGVAQSSYAPPTHRVMVPMGSMVKKAVVFLHFYTHLLGSICYIQTFIKFLVFKDYGHSL